MPLTNLAKAELEALCAEFTAKYRHTPCHLIPKDEKRAQTDRDIAIANADPETLDITCIAMKNFHSEADDRKLRGSPLARNVEAA